MAKERIKAADFVRVITLAYIVFFHCHEELRVTTNPSFMYLFEDIGPLRVACNALFLALSGAMLYLGYGSLDIKSTKADLTRFYKKRVLSIFPSFWIAWGCMYLMKAFLARNPFYKGSPWKLLLSITGLDGYFAYRGDNYYILGEWFLGAIVLLYLFYPLINFCFKKWEIPTVAVSVVLTALAVAGRFWKIGYDRNLFSCMMCFVFGMTYMKHREFFKKPAVTVVALAFTIVFFIVRLPEPAIGYYIFSASLFILLFAVGEWAMKVAPVDRLISFLATFSFEVILTHHICIYAVLGVYSPGTFGQFILVYIIIFVIAAAAAFVLHCISKRIVKK